MLRMYLSDYSGCIYQGRNFHVELGLSPGSDLRFDLYLGARSAPLYWTWCHGLRFHGVDPT